MKTRTVKTTDGRDVTEFVPETDEDREKLAAMIQAGTVDAGAPARVRDLDRERLEWVYGLTGGELADEPWECYEPRLYSDGTDYGRQYEPRQTVERDWYEGVPDYIERHERERWEWTGARTIIGDAHGAPPPWIADEAGIWVRVATFTNSGETECPGRHDDKNIVTEDECPLCEEDQGEEHGWIYIGAGYEAVYVLAAHDCGNCGERSWCKNVEKFAARECGCQERCVACRTVAEEL